MGWIVRVGQIFRSYCQNPHQLKGETVLMRTLGLEKGWIVRSQVDFFVIPYIQPNPN